MTLVQAIPSYLKEWTHSTLSLVSAKTHSYFSDYFISLVSFKDETTCLVKESLKPYVIGLKYIKEHQQPVLDSLYAIDFSSVTVHIKPLVEKIQAQSIKLWNLIDKRSQANENASPELIKVRSELKDAQKEISRLQQLIKDREAEIVKLTGQYGEEDSFLTMDDEEAGVNNLDFSDIRDHIDNEMPSPIKRKSDQSLNGKIDVIDSRYEGNFSKLRNNFHDDSSEN